jgi:hypothetical protein
LELYIDVAQIRQANGGECINAQQLCGFDPAVTGDVICLSSSLNTGLQKPNLLMLLAFCLTCARAYLRPRRSV